MIAALKAGMCALGIDLKPEYCEFTKGRIEELYGPLFT
jgi:hypothetical protein